MRHLVYRVQPLPLSLFSLVFDFGRIDSNTEMQYIEKMASQKVCIWNCKTFGMMWIVIFYGIAICFSYSIGIHYQVVCICFYQLPSQPIRPKSPAGRRGLREMRSMNSMRDVVCKVLQKSQEYMRKDQVRIRYKCLLNYIQ